MHTGTLIEELMGMVDEVMSGSSEVKEQRTFFVWDAAQYEQQIEMQSTLAGVA